MKISIITITYNCVETIERTLKSVIGQTYPDVEYIVVDGASSDGTRDILENYAGYFDFFVSEPDRGVANAYNKALLHATGDVINFMNGDDYFIHNEVLSHVSKEFEENPSTDILVGKDELNIVSSIHDTNRYTNVYIDAVFPHQAIFSKKRVFDEIGNFDEHFCFVGDRDWLLRAWSRGYKFQLKNEVYVHFSVGGRCFGTGNVFEEYEVAKKYLQLTGQEKFLDSAQRRCMETYCEGRVYLFLASNEDKSRRKDFFEAFLDHEKTYCVWGRGSYGTLLISELHKAGYSIKGIVDNSIDRESVEHGIPVFHYDRRRIKGVIIVATPKYDREICKKLISEGYERDSFVAFHEIEKRVLTFISSEEDIYTDFFSKAGLDLEEFVNSPRFLNVYNL